MGSSGPFPGGVKRQGRELYLHSLIFTAWRLIKNKGNFTFLPKRKDVQAKKKETIYL
jgi:hypothetical protein